MKNSYLILSLLILAACTMLPGPSFTPTSLPSVTSTPSPPPPPTPTVTPIDLSSRVQGPIDVLFAADGYLYLNICRAFVVLDLTDPATPAPIGLHWLAEQKPHCFSGETASDLFVFDDLAYVANYESGLHLIDLSDRTAPVEVGRYRPPVLGWNDFPMIPSPDPPRYLYREGARGVVARREADGQIYAYVAAYAAGLRVVNVTDPTAPVEIGALEFELPAAPVALVVQGDYAYLAAGKGGLRLVDISDPAAPVEVGRSPAMEHHWSRQVALATIDDRTVAYLEEDGCQDLRGCYGGLRSVDVTDPTAPREIRFSQEWQWSTVVTVDNVLYYPGTGGMKIIDPETGLVTAVIPDMSFADMAGAQGYLYQGARGLRILDVSDPLAPVVIRTMFDLPPLPTPLPPPAATPANAAAGPNQLPTPTFPPSPQPTATPAPLTPPPDVTPPPKMELYWSRAGRFILQYPPEADFYEGQVPTVDGVLAPAENTVAVHSPDQGNYLLTLTHFELAPGATLVDFINAQGQCAEVTGPGEQTYYLNAYLTANFFPDTNCGPQGSSYLFFIRGGLGYRFTIASPHRFQEIEPHLRPILTSFQTFVDAGLPDVPPLSDESTLLDSLPVIEPGNVARLAPVARLGKGMVRDAVWTPHGRTIVAATPLGLYFYQADTLAEQKFMPTTSPAVAVAISPDGGTVAAAMGDFAVHLWGIKDSGRPEHIFTGHTGPVHRVAFSPNGRRLVSTASDSLLRIWDVSTRQLLSSHPSHPQARLVFSPNERWLALGGGKLNRQVQVIDLENGEQIASLEVQPDLLGLAFSPAGQTLALLPSGRPDNHTLLLWEFAAGQTRRLNHHQIMYSVVFGPDGKTLATGDLDGQVQLWDIAAGAVSRTLSVGQETGVRALTFSPNGAYLAATDGTSLKIWEMAGGTVAVDITGFKMTTPTFSPDSAALMFRRGGTVGLVDLASRRWQLLPGHSDLLTELAYSADGRWLAAADWSGLVHLWDTTTGQPAQVVAGHTGPVAHVAFSADGQRLVTGGVNEDKSAKLWTVPEIIQAEPGIAPPQEAFSFGPDDSLLDLALSPDGGTLALATHDTGVTLRDLDSGQARQFTAPQEQVLSLAFSPDGTRLAAGSFDETVQVWDVSSGQSVANLAAPQMGVVANVIFTPNGRWLIAGGQQNRIYGWEIDPAAVAQQIEGRGIDLALNPAGTLLAFKKTLDDVVIGDIFAAREAIQFAGGRPLAFSADGRLLAVGSTEGVLTLWGVP